MPPCYFNLDGLTIAAGAAGVAGFQDLNPLMQFAIGCAEVLALLLEPVD